MWSKLRIEHPGAVPGRQKAEGRMLNGRQNCTMGLKWIAAHLQRGTWTCVSNLLNEPPETQPPAQEVLPLCQ